MHLFGVLLKVPKSVMDRSVMAYKADLELRGNALNSKDRKEIDKESALKAVKILESAVHLTEQRIYGALLKQSV